MSLLSSVLLAITVVAHDPGYHTSLANHIVRWLGSEGIAAKSVTPAQMESALRGEQLAFLVGFGTPSAAELSTLKSYRARGGKLVVFHSANPALASLMGVKPIGYAKAPYPGAWSKMNFDTTAIAGIPASIRQTSGVLIKAAPIRGRGVVIATWLDRRGKATGDAAWIQTDAGWWMTHVLMGDGDEPLKAQLVSAMCAAVNPRIWNAAESSARKRQKANALKAYAMRQTGAKGEIHAVWDHSGCGLYPGDWSRTMRLLRDSHVTDIFVNVSGFDFAHYPSQVLPRSKTFLEEGDQLAKCLAAAKGTGIRVHVWILCFTEGRGVKYVNPGDSSVRNRIISAIDELQVKYPSISGIHLDFVRYDEKAVKPKNASLIVSSFVAEARRHVKRPKWLTAAVYGGYQNAINNVGQDWVSWLDTNLVDYVVPMDYTSSMVRFCELLGAQSLKRSHARRTIVGLGVTANESRLDARQVIDQIKASRRMGFAGNALFDLDTVLETDVLPYLRLGIW